jgi:hypothetical protein
MNKNAISPSFTMLPEEQFEELKGMITDLHSQKQEEIKIKDYISKENVCKHMGWGEATWYRLRKDEMIKVYRIGKKQYLKVSELEKTLQEGTL